MPNCVLQLPLSGASLSADSQAMCCQHRIVSVSESQSLSWGRQSRARRQLCHPHLWACSSRERIESGRASDSQFVPSPRPGTLFIVSDLIPFAVYSESNAKFAWSCASRLRGWRASPDLFWSAPLQQPREVQEQSTH